jgi:hypothetical protein
MNIESEAKHPFNIGANYFIRTVTHYHTGRLVEVTENELVLEDAAWIANSGRFADAPRPIITRPLGKGSTS